jgi:hypothetical protein
MADNTKDMRGNVPKLPEVKPYEPVPYDMEGRSIHSSQTKSNRSRDINNLLARGAFQPDFEARDSEQLVGEISRRIAQNDWLHEREQAPNGRHSG